MKTNAKGFTLIELLVVIAIVAILAVVVVLTLNPAELLKQARDSNRIQDLNTMSTAISVLLADVNPTATTLTASAAHCYMSASTTPSTYCGFASTGLTTVVSSTNRNVNGTGWIPINFTLMSTGAPLGQLPIDPTNSGIYVYRYAANPTAQTYKLMAPLESVKYLAAGAQAATDGGTSTTAFEAGTNLAL